MREFRLDQLAAKLQAQAMTTAQGEDMFSHVQTHFVPLQAITEVHTRPFNRYGRWLILGVKEGLMLSALRMTRPTESPHASTQQAAVNQVVGST